MRRPLGYAGKPMRLALLSLLAALPCLAGEIPPEAQFALQSFRDGEKARLEAAVGSVELMPLVRAELDVQPAQRRVVGNVSITLTAKRAMSSVYLRLVPNANHPGTVELLQAAVNGQRAKVARPDVSLVQLGIEPPVKAGAQVQLALRVQATLPELPEGSDALSGSGDGAGGDYGAFSAAADVVGLSGILPMVPPETADGLPTEGPSGIGDLGTFEPTNFMVSVLVPSEWRAVAGGQLLGDLPETGGRHRTTWALAAAREFPLLAVKGYEVASRQAGSVTVESYYLARDAASGKASLEHAVKALEQLESRVGPYPYKTLRVVQARFVGGAGGMEFPGLVTVSTALYRGAIDPLTALNLPDLNADPMLKAVLAPVVAPLLKDSLEFTVAHEVAHQYFAMLVGNDPIAAPVADEALTQHVALLLMEWRRGKAAAETVRQNQLKMSYQVYRMNGGADGPANRATHEFGSNLEYAALVYGKAPLLFDAQRKLLGEATWEALLKRYVAENRYKWVTSTTLTELAAKQVPGHAKKLRELRQRWWAEAHGDEDVGTLNLERLMETMGGPDSPEPKVDPALAKELEELLKHLSGE